MSTILNESATGERNLTTSLKRNNDLKTTTRADGQPQTKRSRVSRACDQCRASREKCDGSQPICHSCVVQQRTCTYNEQPKKRGIQPNYIRTLEITLAWFTKTYPEGVSELAQCLPISDHPTTRLLAAKDSDAAEDLHSFWRNSIICRQIDQLLSGGIVEKPDLPRKSTPMHDRDGLGHPPTPPEHSLLPNSSSMTPISSASHHNDKVKLPHHAWKLLEYYFAFTHSWMPLTEKTKILKMMYSYPEDGLHRSKCATPAYAELWAILALAEIQMSTDSESKIDSKTLQIAQSLIPYTTYRLSHGYIKALLLFTLIEITRRAWMSAWLTVGLATRLVSFHEPADTPLHCHSDFLSTPQSIPKSTNSNSRHRLPSDIDEDSMKACFLASLVLEHAISSECHLPVCFNPRDLTSADLLQEDGPEEWAPWQNPLVPVSSARAPTRAYTSLNSVVRDIMQATQPVISGSPHPCLVMQLVRNGAGAQTQEQPYALISRKGAARATQDTSSGTPANSLSPLRHDSSYMSIPQRPNSYDTLGDSPSTSQRFQGAQHAWQEAAAVPTMDPNDVMASAPMDLAVIDTEANIFEELALLERNDSSQHPDFMRNLGFGPDIDLAEFFGADYQPSDPMLAYLQPPFGPLTTTDSQIQLDNG